MKKGEEVGTLALTEAHPASYSALEWIKNQSPVELALWMESFSSCAISGNRLAEICSETLRRLIDGEPVSDRYLLGLAWSMRDGERLIESVEKAARAEGEAQGEVKDADSERGDKVARGRKRKARGEGSSRS